MKVFPLLALLPLSLAAQTPIPSGNYKANSLGNALELRFLPNGTYELIATSGEYTIKDKKILFQPQSSSFAVEKKQSDSQDLLDSSAPVIGCRGNYQLDHQYYTPAPHLEC